MNRRELIKSFFAVGALALCPCEGIAVLENFTMLQVDLRELVKRRLAEWYQKEMDKLLFEYLTREAI